MPRSILNEFKSQLLEYLEDETGEDLAYMYATGKWPTYCELSSEDIDAVERLRTEYLSQFREIVRRANGGATEKWVESFHNRVDVKPIIDQLQGRGS